VGIRNTDLKEEFFKEEKKELGRNSGPVLDEAECLALWQQHEDPVERTH
jgi:hypothetical protein